MFHVILHIFKVISIGSNTMWTSYFGGKKCCPMDIEGSYFVFEIAQNGFLQKCSRNLELNAIYFELFQNFHT